MNTTCAETFSLSCWVEVKQRWAAPPRVWLWERGSLSARPWWSEVWATGGVPAAANNKHWGGGVKWWWEECVQSADQSTTSWVVCGAWPQGRYACTVNKPESRSVRFRGDVEMTQLKKKKSFTFFLFARAALVLNQPVWGGLLVWLVVRVVWCSYISGS